MEKAIAIVLAVLGDTRLGMNIRNWQNGVKILSDREYESLIITKTIEI